MASKTNNMTLVLSVADQRLQATLRRVNTSINRVGTNSKKAAVTTERSFGGARKSIAKFSEATRTAVVNLRYLAGLFAGGALGASAIKFASDFEYSMAAVNTLLDKNSKNVAQFSKELVELSKRSSKDLLDLSKALYQIVSAGIPAADAMNVLNNAQKLAVAGMAETEQAADALITVMQAYRRTGISAARASDVLFETVRKGRTTIPELSKAIGRAAPLAAQFGMSIEELSALLVQLTKAGLNTNEAMTAIRSLMAGLAKPTQRTQKLLSVLGVSFSQAAIQQKGFVGVLSDLTEKTNGSVEVLARLFPNIRALLPAVVTVGQGFEDYNATLEQVKISAGATSEANAKVSETFQTQAKILRSKWQAALEKAGAVLSVKVLPLIKQLGVFLDDNAEGFAKGFGEFVDVAIDLAKALAAVLVPLGKVVGMVMPLAPLLLFVGGFALLKKAALMANVAVGGFFTRMIASLVTTNGLLTTASVKMGAMGRNQALLAQGSRAGTLTVLPGGGGKVNPATGAAPGKAPLITPVPTGPAKAGMLSKVGSFFGTVGRVAGRLFWPAMIAMFAVDLLKGVGEAIGGYLYDSFYKEEDEKRLKQAKKDLEEADTILQAVSREEYGVEFEAKVKLDERIESGELLMVFEELDKQLQKPGFGMDMFDKFVTRAISAADLHRKMLEQVRKEYMVAGKAGLDDLGRREAANRTILVIQENINRKRREANAVEEKNRRVATAWRRAFFRESEEEAAGVESLLKRGNEFAAEIQKIRQRMASGELDKKAGDILIQQQKRNEKIYFDQIVSGARLGEEERKRLATMKDTLGILEKQKDALESQMQTQKLLARIQFETKTVQDAVKQSAKATNQIYQRELEIRKQIAEIAQNARLIRAKAAVKEQEAVVKIARAERERFRNEVGLHQKNLKGRLAAVKSLFEAEKKAVEKLQRLRLKEHQATTSKMMRSLEKANMKAFSAEIQRFAKLTDRAKKNAKIIIEGINKEVEFPAERQRSLPTTRSAIMEVARENNNSDPAKLAAMPQFREAIKAGNELQLQSMKLIGLANLPNATAKMVLETGKQVSVMVDTARGAYGRTLNDALKMELRASRAASMAQLRIQQAAERRANQAFEATLIRQAAAAEQSAQRGYDQALEEAERAAQRINEVFSQNLRFDTIFAQQFEGASKSAQKMTRQVEAYIRQLEGLVRKLFAQQRLELDFADFAVDEKSLDNIRAAVGNAIKTSDKLNAEQKAGLPSYIPKPTSISARTPELSQLQASMDAQTQAKSKYERDILATRKELTEASDRKEIRRLKKRLAAATKLHAKAQKQEAKLEAKLAKLAAVEAAGHRRDEAAKLAKFVSTNISQLNASAFLDVLPEGQIERFLELGRTIDEARQKLNDLKDGQKDFSKAGKAITPFLLQFGEGRQSLNTGGRTGVEANRTLDELISEKFPQFEEALDQLSFRARAAAQQLGLVRGPEPGQELAKALDFVIPFLSTTEASQKQMLAGLGKETMAGVKSIASSVGTATLSIVRTGTFGLADILLGTNTGSGGPLAMPRTGALFDQADSSGTWTGLVDRFGKWFEANNFFNTKEWDTFGGWTRRILQIGAAPARLGARAAVGTVRAGETAVRGAGALGSILFGEERSSFQDRIANLAESFNNTFGTDVGPQSAEGLNEFVEKGGLLGTGGQLDRFFDGAQKLDGFWGGVAGGLVKPIEASFKVARYGLKTVFDGAYKNLIAAWQDIQLIPALLANAVGELTTGIVAGIASASMSFNFAGLADAGIKFAQTVNGIIVKPMESILGPKLAKALGPLLSLPGQILSVLNKTILAPAFAAIQGPWKVLTGGIADAFSTLADPSQLDSVHQQEMDNISKEHQAEMARLESDLHSTRDINRVQEIRSQMTEKEAEHQKRIAEAQQKREESTPEFKIKKAIDDALELASKIAEQLPEIARLAMDAIIDNFPALFEKAVDALVGLFDVLAEKLPEFVVTIIQSLIDAFPRLIGAVVKFIPALLDAVLDGLLLIMENLDEMVISLIDGLVEMLPVLIQSLAEKIPLIITAFIEALPAIVIRLIQALPTVVAALIHGAVIFVVEIVKNTPKIIWAIIKSLPEIILELILLLPRMVYELGQMMGDEFIKFIKEAGELLLEIITLGISEGEFLGIGDGEQSGAQFGKAAAGGAVAGAAIGSLGGPVGALIGAGVGGLVGGIASLFHKGGEVVAAARNKYGASVLRGAGAPQFANGGFVTDKMAEMAQGRMSGIARDEVPAVLQVGEGVLNRRAMAALGGEATLAQLNRGEVAAPSVNVGVGIEPAAGGMERAAEALLPYLIKGVVTNIDQPGSALRNRLNSFSRGAPYGTMPTPRNKPGLKPS